MRRITTVVSGTGQYEICEDKNGFWAIEHGYLDKDGRLARTITGLQGHLRETFKDAVDTAMFNGKVKEWRENNPEATEKQMMEFMVATI